MVVREGRRPPCDEEGSSPSIKERRTGTLNDGLSYVTFIITRSRSPSGILRPSKVKVHETPSIYGTTFPRVRSNDSLLCGTLLSPIVTLLDLYTHFRRSRNIGPVIGLRRLTNWGRFLFISSF